jgi:hypothetical protein
VLEALLRPPQVPPRPAHRASSSKHLCASLDDKAKEAKEEDEEAKGVEEAAEAEEEEATAGT